MPTSAPIAEPAGMSHAWRGRVGMIGLIIAEGSLFAVFVVAYLFYIGKSLNGPYPKDVLELPVLGTICLLSSSVFVVLGVAGARARATSGAPGVWLARHHRCSARSSSPAPRASGTG